MTSAEDYAARASALEAIATIGRRRTELRAEWEANTVDLRIMIRRARELGATLQDCADAAGLSPQRIAVLLEQ